MTKLLNLYLNHFPKHEKYALCSVIRNTNYRLYDLMTEATKRYHKKTTLQNMDIEHQKLRMQVYLAYELGYFAFRDGAKASVQDADRYMKISKLIDDLGAMIGAWVKSEKQKIG